MTWDLINKVNSLVPRWLKLMKFCLGAHGTHLTPGNKLSRFFQWTHWTGIDQDSGKECAHVFHINISQSSLGRGPSIQETRVQALKGLTHSTSALSRRHHLHPFSQKLRCGLENIWRKVVHFNKLNNVSSNFFQNMLSGLADDRLEQTTSSAPVFSKTKVWIGKY
jgi:hypothetical protein